MQKELVIQEETTRPHQDITHKNVEIHREQPIQARTTERILPPPPSRYHKVMIGSSILYEGTDAQEATRLFLGATELFTDQIMHTVNEISAKSSIFDYACEGSTNLDHGSAC